MIKSFGNRIAEDLFNDRGSAAMRTFPGEFLPAARRKLLYLHDAAELKDLRIPRHNQLHSLKSSRGRFYSLRIGGPWHLRFRFDRGTAGDVAVLRRH
ncbi:MAG TPA: type II toxin-antitoxin system RelE/ParE family toxin [Steroidobacteraceae bacterium]|nr:type II toxin-antitoxin system RelE/ParE family toxin [Steroidobacteraceae bacterium]